MIRLTQLMILLAAMVCLLPVNAISVQAGVNAPQQRLLVGASLRDITPTVANGVLPLTRTTRSGIVSGLSGNIDPLYVRVIALSDGTSKSLFVAFDLGGPPTPSVLVPLLAKHTGLPETAIFFCATHAHATPMVPEKVDTATDFGKKQQIFSDLVRTQLLAAADEALEKLQPATVGIGYSKSYINVNRNYPYKEIGKDGKVYNYTFLGYNGAIPVDRTVSALRFDDLEGNPIAFIINYPVHCTVMYLNTYVNGSSGVSADIAGFISTNLEKRYKGAVAAWTSGAAGDLNPIIMNQMYMPDPETGGFKYSSQGEVSILELLGSIHYRDVLDAIETVDKVTSDVSVKTEYGTTMVPGRSVELESEDDGDGLGLHTKYRYGDGDPITLPLYVLRLGDIALVGYPGEMFNAVGTYIKQNSVLKNTIVVTLGGVPSGIRVGYTPDDYSIEHGGYTLPSSRFKPGYISNSLSILANTLIEKGR